MKKYPHGISLPNHRTAHHRLKHKAIRHKKQFKRVKPALRLATRPKRHPHHTLDKYSPDIVSAMAQHLGSVFVQLMDTSQHYIFLKDRRSVYFECNRAFARLVGLPSPVLLPV